MEPALKHSVDSWNSAFGKTLLDYEFEDYNPFIPSENASIDGKRKIYFIHDWWKVSTNMLEWAVTNYYYRENVIVEADIYVNTSFDFYFKDSNNPIRPRQGDFESVLLHELGHVLGLGHYQEGVMAPEILYGTKARTLTDKDIFLIKEKYQDVLGK